MRLRITSAALLAVLLGAAGSVGCGKKSKPSDGEVTEAPPPVPPLTTPPVRPAVVPRPAPPPVETVPALPPPVLPQPPLVVPMIPVVPPPATVPPSEPMVVVPQPPTVPLPPPTITPGAKVTPKELPKPKDAEWPKEIFGRDLMAYVKDCTDPDPAMREMGLRTLPGFGPTARKVLDKDGRNLFGKTVISRMAIEREKDPGVRSAAFATAATMGFEDEADNREAVRILGTTADVGVSGGMARQNAIQALAAFGTKAEGAVIYLVGAPVTDVSYETRRSIAFTLGKIAFNETTGPSAKALTCLTSSLANDPSAVVRLEAMQSLAILGPPWEGIHPPGDKTPPKLDMKGVAAHVTALRKRLAPAPSRPGEKTSSGLVERDKQVEIWLRLVLMRFDVKELTADENLNVIGRAVGSSDHGARIQALAILGMMGEVGAKRLDDITRVLTTDDLEVVQAALGALASLGVNAKPALPEVRKLLTHKDEGIRKMTAEVIKYITDAKTPAAEVPPPKKKP